MKRLFLLTVGLIFALGSLQAEISNLSDVKKTLRDNLAQCLALQPGLDTYYSEQYSELQDITEECHRLQLELYSNKTDYIFHTTATLKQIHSLNDRIHSRTIPDNTLISRSRNEIERLSLLRNELLLEDSTNRERDTCLACTEQLLQLYNQLSERELNLCAQYSLIESNFSEAYNYMLEREKGVKQQVFHAGQITYGFLIKNLPTILKSRGNKQERMLHDQAEESEGISTAELGIIWGQMLGLLALAVLISLGLWYANKRRHFCDRFVRNIGIYTNLIWVSLCVLFLGVDIFALSLPMLTQAGPIFLVYLLFTIILQVSLMLREEGEKASAAMHLYAPGLFFGFCTIFIRLMLLPNLVITFILFPLALVTFIWSLLIFRRYWFKASSFDCSMAAITVAVLAAIMVMSALGYVFMAMILFLWWQAQEAVLLGGIAIFRLLKRYENGLLEKRKLRYHDRMSSNHAIRQQSLIQVTWFYDLIKMVLLPGLIIASIPYCMYSALEYFNAGENYNDFFYNAFYSLTRDGDAILELSCYSICRVLILFFIVRYLIYFLTQAYSQLKVHIEVHRSGSERIAANQVNKSMGVNIINIIGWALYIASCCIILKIPTSALTFIFAGLATGIGFAMRDVLNNLFYGIQLMAGRLNVGDYIICGPYRGSVTSISYQTTQMKTEENALVYFPNADLFAKNFQNLTRENPYEVNRVYCSVAYGSDIALAERLIREAIEPLNEPDQYGRPLLSPMEGIRIEMTKLEDSGIEMAVRFGVIAERRTWFLPVLRKAIYSQLQQGGIRIPFPQMDLHVVAEDNTTQNS